MALKIDMGVVACDEENAIGPMLRSLFQQSLFSDSEIDVEEINVFILANGCSDGTAEVARSFFAKNPDLENAKSSLEVVEFDYGDKATTWNRFVHELSIC